MLKEKGIVWILVLLILVFSVVAAGELTQKADQLNYFDTSLNHTVTITNSAAAGVNLNVTLASGWTYQSGTNCILIPATTINCNVSAGGSASYTVSDPNGADAEYKVTTFPIVAVNNSYTGNSVKFLKIQDKELFHTLVEYGRGRGNYFFDSQFSGAGSGHTGDSCNYLPNSTLFELNFLHKVMNVNQWFGNLSAEAYNATFSCTYPNRTVIRNHLISAIEINSTGVFVGYDISKISNDWERMGFLSMDFASDMQYVGENLTINCTNLTYYYPNAGGNMVVDEDSFTFQVRGREPFISSASTASVVGNGTQEVVITYNITNNEVYSLNDVIIEIAAPEYATFVGTRAELWGASRDIYRLEKSQLNAGESMIVSLVARFDTSAAPSLSALNLTQGIDANYVTCWELNAYNPTEYTQTISPAGVGSTSVNLSVSSTIVNIPNIISTIFNLTTKINLTITSINATVNNIENIVNVINTTTQNTNILVDQINATSNTILNTTNSIIANTNTIINDTSFIIDELNCNGTIDSPLCTKISSINTSIYNLWNLTLDLNNTANNLNITIIENINTSGVNVTATIDFSNLTADLREIKSYINCSGYVNQSTTSVCNRLDRVENLTIEINSSVQSISNFTNYFNSTVFGNVTFQDIVDAIGNITVDTTDVLNSLQELREFDEELVFLVTDSFGLQQQARSEFYQGDVESAAQSLNEANQRLIEATDRLESSRDEAEQSSGDLLAGTESSMTWLLAFIIIAIIAIFLAFKVLPDKSDKMNEKEGGTQ